MDRVLELAQRRAELVSELNKVTAELVQAVNEQQAVLTGNAPVSTPAPATPSRKTAASPKPRQQSTATNGNGGGNGGNRQSSLKEVVQTILGRSRNGMELKEIVAEVTRMIQNGEYVSKASKVTPVVSQALHQLKQEKLIAVEKSPESNRNLYSLNKKEAA